jgi:hypothetical protein
MSEKELAKSDGSRLVKNSGRGLKKGDAVYGKYLIDYKETEKSSYSLNIDKFSVHLRNAYIQNQHGIYVVWFKNNNKKVAIIEWSLLKDLIEGDTVDES